MCPFLFLITLFLPAPSCPQSRDACAFKSICKVFRHFMFSQSTNFKLLERVLIGWNADCHNNWLMSHLAAHVIFIYELNCHALWSLAFSRDGLVAIFGECKFPAGAGLAQWISKRTREKSKWEATLHFRVAMNLCQVEKKAVTGNGKEIQPGEDGTGSRSGHWPSLYSAI